MRTIVIATDFSDAAQNATDYAAALAQRAGAKLIIFHEYFYPSFNDQIPVSKDVYEQALVEDQKMTEELAQNLRLRYKIDVEYLLSSKPLAKELELLVKNQHADLIIMGIRGKFPSDRMIFGSTSVSVLRHARFPVLLIPENCSFKEPKNILFTYLPQSVQSSAQLKVLKSFTSLFNAKLKVLQVKKQRIDAKEAPDHKRQMTTLNRIFKNYKFDYTEIEGKSVFDGIEQEISKADPDLLVMVPKHQNVWETGNKKSNTQKVAMRTQIPLLTIPD